MNDGMLICSGPWAKDEWYKFVSMWNYDMLQLIHRYVMVNDAPKYIDIGMPYDWISLDWKTRAPFKDHPFCNIVEFESKTGQDSQFMECDDFPFLVNNGISMFTGIHHLVCLGCRDIVGIGINLYRWPNGRYSTGGDGKDADHIFNRTREIWENYTLPFLNEHNIRFRSAAFCTKGLEYEYMADP